MAPPASCCIKSKVRRTLELSALSVLVARTLGHRRSKER